VLKECVWECDIIISLNHKITLDIDQCCVLIVKEVDWWDPLLVVPPTDPDLQWRVQNLNLSNWGDDVEGLEDGLWEELAHLMSFVFN
jgi:hypothetical protein